MNEVRAVLNHLHLQGYIKAFAKSGFDSKFAFVNGIISQDLEAIEKENEITIPFGHKRVFLTFLSKEKDFDNILEKINSSPLPEDDAVQNTTESVEDYFKEHTKTKKRKSQEEFDVTTALTEKGVSQETFLILSNKVKCLICNTLIMWKSKATERPLVHNVLSHFKKKHPSK